MIVRFSEKAILDLDDVWLYGMSQFGFEKADRYTAELKRRIDLLQEHPALGRLVARNPFELRLLTYDWTVVLYSLTEDFVNIDRITDGRRDIESLVADIIR